MREIEVYSHEELMRRLQWCRDRKDPPISQIARWVETDRGWLSKVMSGKEKPSAALQRMLTDFFHKWDAGIFVMFEGKLIKTKNPKPRVNLTVDWRNPKIKFQNNAQVMGVTEWLGDAISRLEMLGSSENISVSPTGHLRGTKKSARKGVPR